MAMATRDAGADRAALLRRYNAAVVTDAPITDDIATLSDFDGAKKDLDFTDDGEDGEFSLPMSHVPSNNLSTEDLQQASMDTPIAPNNVGYRLLKKMGWKDHTGLGRNGAGIVDPIRISTNLGSLGVGKLAEDAEYTNAENVKRKALDIEVELSAEQLKKREVQVEKEKAIKEVVAENRKVFFCELCNKQYKMITEYEAHLSSYDHNHKKRFQEMRQMERARTSKKDTKVDKEMQRLMAQAAAAQQRHGNPTPKTDATQSHPTHDVDPPPPPPSEAPPPPPPSDDPPRPAIKFGFGKKPSAPTHPHHSHSQPPPLTDPPPPPPPTDEPSRQAVKFGFSKKQAGNSTSHFSSPQPPPPPPPDVPPPPPPVDPHPLASQPVKFSFNMQKKR